MNQVLTKRRNRIHLLQTLLLRSAARIICSDESKNIEFINIGLVPNQQFDFSLNTTITKVTTKSNGKSNVNNYDFFRNPIEAKDLIIDALQIQKFENSNIFDGELDGRMIKIMPVNRIATKADLEELKANLPYRKYDIRKEENPLEAVEKITFVCMGHEPSLKAEFEKEVSPYKIDIEILDILRDKKELQLKRDSDAVIEINDGYLEIKEFYPMNLLQKLSFQKEQVEDWRELVESIMIDWNYDGAVMEPSIMDIPDKKELVEGRYKIPEDAGKIRIKITDLLSESLEVEV